MYTGEVLEPCADCNGFGNHAPSFNKCQSCGGKGWLKQQKQDESVDSSIERVIHFYDLYARKCISDDCNVVLIRPRNHYCSKCREDRATRVEKRGRRRQHGKRPNLQVVVIRGVEAIVEGN